MINLVQTEHYSLHVLTVHAEIALSALKRLPATITESRQIVTDRELLLKQADETGDQALRDAVLKTRAEPVRTLILFTAAAPLIKCVRVLNGVRPFELNLIERKAIEVSDAQ